MDASSRIHVPPFDIVWEGMDLDPAALEEGTQDARFEGRGSGLLKTGAVGGVILFFIGVCLNCLGSTLGLVIALAAAAVAGVCAFVALSRAKVSRDYYGAEVAAPMLQQLLDGMTVTDKVAPVEVELDARYEIDGSVNRSELAHSGLFFDSRMVQEDVITGRLGRTDFTLADLKWNSAEPPEQRAAATDPEPSWQARRDARARVRREPGGDRLSSREVSERAESLLRSSASNPLLDKLSSKLEASMRESHTLGPSLIYFSADFHKEFTSETYFVPSTRMKGLESRNADEAERAGLVPVELTGMDLPKGIRGWTTDPAEAHYLLTPQLVLALNELSEQMDTRAIGVSFADSRMTVAIGTDSNYFSLDPKNSDVRAVSEQIYDDIVRFLSLVEDFDLNTRIWTKR